jgi:hypothetical protein
MLLRFLHYYYIINFREKQILRKEKRARGVRARVVYVLLVVPEMVRNLFWCSIICAC